MVKGRIQEWLNPETALLKGQRLRKWLYVYLVCYSLFILVNSSSLFGAHSLIIPYPVSGFSLFAFSHILSYPFFIGWEFVFPLLVILFVIASVLLRFPRTIAFFIWFLVININNRVYLLNTSGEALLNILLFFLVFLSGGKHPKNVFFKLISELTDAFVVIACTTQLLLIYIVSAWYKCMDAEWINGEATEIIFKLPQYTSTYLPELIADYSGVCKLITWTVLLFQLAFPFFLISNRLKRLGLIIGICFHLFVGVFMGLPFFAAIMIISYTLFYNVDPSRLALKK